MNRDTDPRTLKEQRATSLDNVALIAVSDTGDPIQIRPKFFRFKPTISDRLALVKRRNYQCCVANTESGSIPEFGTTSVTQALALHHRNRVEYFMSYATGARFNVGVTAGLISFHLHAWARNSDRWDLLGITENLLPKLTDEAFNTITFDKPLLNLPAGAFIGWGAEGNCVTALAPVLDSQLNTVAVTAPAIAVVSGLWNSETTLFNGKAVNISLLGSSPDVVLLGDSIMTGYPHSSALHEDLNYSKGNLDFTESKTPGALMALNGFSVLNAGVAGETSTEVVARSNGFFSSGAILLCVHCGTNDIAAMWPANPESTVVNNIISIIEGAAARNVFVIVDSILPRNDWVGAYAGANIYRRAINARLKELCDTKYAGQAYFLDLDSTFGTGTDNDTLKTAYAHTDGIHLSAAGTNALSAIYYTLATTL